MIINDKRDDPYRMITYQYITKKSERKKVFYMPGEF